MARVLVVDDERSMRELMEILLRREGHEVALASDGAEALGRFDDGRPDLVIQDLKMPGMSGLELLKELKQRAAEVPVVVITAFSTWDNTVEAMRLGAYDYVKKPFDTGDIRAVVERALARGDILRSARRDEPEPLELVGNSPAMRRVVEVVRRVAPTEATVLIQGESGTGKELVARMCHYHSRRAGKPFIVVNCGAFTENLLESELFGHVRGAFTGAIADKQGLLRVAHGGTFFMDEVGELSSPLQVKLLRVLEERRFFPVGSTRTERTDVRFVCATNRDLEAEVREGRFRSDLYYRLNVIPISLPPLRERLDDIPLLAGHFVRKHGERAGRDVQAIAPDLQGRLQAYAWPGNVRELENAIQRAIALSTGPVLEDVGLLENPAEPSGDRDGAAHDGAWLLVDGGAARPALKAAPPPLPEEGLDLEQSLAQYERALLARALERTEGNVTRAAELLGITFRSMRYKVRKLGLRDGDRA